MQTLDHFPVKNKYRGTPNYIRVLAELVRAAEYRGVTTYQDVAVIMGLPLQGGFMAGETGRILGEISEDEVKAGPGFFVLAKQLGRFGGGTADEEGFWQQELQAVYDTWKRPLHKPSKDT